eukprot:Cvel_16074.t1-p1 / transcript=Cvel_16074.t1 / gene=Cvel_16074 / organism=Chromera_velia_CCMP2878 / gene_product=hypothetical protein / transcript_product=hypothetical protein / location=Cvel_scaffold1222:1284-4189(-) / protein_length=712 / sequence_SO=supercontig / SO=protein_coding / is_pseudo=false
MSRQSSRDGLHFCLIGFGPHAKRIYIPFIRELGSLQVVVELSSRAPEALTAFPSSPSPPLFVEVPDAERDALDLSERVCSALTEALRERRVDVVIVSTEPKAHRAFLKFLLHLPSTQRGTEESDGPKPLPLRILVDKPITVPSDYGDGQRPGDEVRRDFSLLRGLQEKSQHECFVMVQRRMHEGYRWLLEEVKSLTHAFDLPITYMFVFHCDGCFVLPSEYSKENHPYKYGYGKLCHSGYHFVDLACWLWKETLPPSLRSERFSISVQTLKGRPEDVSKMLQRRTIAVLKGELPQRQGAEEEGRKEAGREANCGGELPGVPCWGEQDLSALVGIHSRGGALVSTFVFSLLQSGLSLRAWRQPKADGYKGNGRVRHEKVVIEVGPLAAAHVESLQGHQVRERPPDTCPRADAVGGLDHFEVSFFRNSDLVGGERLTVKSFGRSDTDTETESQGVSIQKEKEKNPEDQSADQEEENALHPKSKEPSSPIEMSPGKQQTVAEKSSASPKERKEDTQDEAQNPLYSTSSGSSSNIGRNDQPTVPSSERRERGQPVLATGEIGGSGASPLPERFLLQHPVVRETSAAVGVRVWERPAAAPPTKQKRRSSAPCCSLSHASAMGRIGDRNSNGGHSGGLDGDGIMTAAAAAAKRPSPVPGQNETARWQLFQKVCCGAGDRAAQKVGAHTETGEQVQGQRKAEALQTQVQGCSLAGQAMT